MDPHVYPDPQLAPLTLPAAPPTGVTKSTFIEIEQVTAPGPTTGARTMCIRIGMSDAVCASLTGPTAPNFHLQADTGDPVPLAGETRPIYHAAGSNLADYVADCEVSLESNPNAPNIFFIEITINRAGSYKWRLGIANNDTDSPRDFTWVVSGTPANTAQPWINVEPNNLSWDLLVGDSLAQDVQINNKGTAAFTVGGVSPAVPAGFTLGPLPGLLKPGASAPLTITFTAPSQPPPAKGVVTATVNATITPADSTAGTSAGHNQQLSLSATIRLFRTILSNQPDKLSADPADLKTLRWRTYAPPLQ